MAITKLLLTNVPARINNQKGLRVGSGDDVEKLAVVGITPDGWDSVARLPVHLA